jgi:predicted DNA-binding protein
MDKLLDAFTFKCTVDLKQRLAAVAIADGLDASEFVRMAVEREIESRRAYYEALHNVFGQSKGDKV